MKRYLWLFWVSLALMAVLVVTGCNNGNGKSDIGSEENPAEAYGLVISEKTITLTEEESTTLTVTYYPSNATNKTITWTSSDNTIATVTGGVVRAVKAGTAVITVALNNGIKDTCSVTVERLPRSNIAPSWPDNEAVTTITLYAVDLDFGPLYDDLGQTGPGASLDTWNGADYQAWLLAMAGFCEAQNIGASRLLYDNPIPAPANENDKVKSITFVLQVDDATIALPGMVSCQPYTNWYNGEWINDIRDIPSSMTLAHFLHPSTKKVGSDYFVTCDLTDNRLRNNLNITWGDHRSIALGPYAAGWGQANAIVKSVTITIYGLPEELRDLRTTRVDNGAVLQIPRNGMDRPPTFNRERFDGLFVDHVTAGTTGNTFEFSHEEFGEKTAYMGKLLFQVTSTNIDGCTFSFTGLPADVASKIAPIRAVKTGNNQYDVVLELFENSTGALGLTAADQVTLNITGSASINGVRGVFFNLPEELL